MLPFATTFHGITGMLAIVLMLFHAVWLVPCLSGMIFGMGFSR